MSATSVAEDHALIAEARGGCRAARDRLILKYWRWILREERRARGRLGVVRDPCGTDSMTAEAVAAFVRSIHKYDSSSGTPFLGYSRVVVRRELCAARANEGVIRVPVGAWNNPRLSAAAERAKAVRSLDEPKKNRRGESVGLDFSFRSPEGAEHRSSRLRGMDAAVIKDIFGELSGRAQTAMRMRIDGVSFTQIGDAMGLSYEEVRSIVTSARMSMQRKLRARALCVVDDHSVRTDTSVEKRVKNAAAPCAIRLSQAPSPKSQVPHPFPLQGRRP